MWNRMVFALLEIVAAALFLIPAMALLNRVRFHSVRKTLAYCVFCCYLVAVYSLVGLPCITYIRFDINANLIPLLGMRQDLRNSILNVLLFVPLGFLLPLFWEGYRNWKKTMLFGASMSLSIECMQMLTMRATDVNDLITNVLGTCLGYVLCYFVRKQISGMGRILINRNDKDVFLISGITLVVMFFFQPFPAAYLWDVFLSG